MMRKHQQRQILELLQMIEEAQSEGLYADCQNSVFNIGTFIEELEGEGTRTVTLLEEYHELLFKASIGEISDKQLRRHLIHIENSVIVELKPNRFEMVFLPYKSGMWDSFESIYLAAKNDPQCDVFVVPVPYYERTPDGSLSAMHCDAADYPEYVQVSDWREFDLISHRPDFIFTHNPYDEHNLISSIHPDYYCSKLKDYTDFLVYVDYGLPYFLPRSIINADFPYALLPAQVYTNLYFTYSQEHKNYMLEIARHYIDNNGLQSLPYFDVQKIPEDIFIDLGSPKFDKIINSSRSDFSLTPEWSKLIKDTNKKIILWNLAVNELLESTSVPEYDETLINELYSNYIENVRNILNLFMDNNDIVLWWRPHPLIEETFRSLRPQLLSDYLKLTEDFIKSGKGIFDTTSDLHRAIQWCDAYYGDESSLVFMLCALGKPFTISKPLNPPGSFPELTDDDTDFSKHLKWRIENLQNYKGAVINEDINRYIWWGNFYESENREKFLNCFLHFVSNMDEYPDADLYKELLIKLYRDFVTNSDGTAGQKIFDYCKSKLIW